jgi:hypothetical protein
MILTYIEFSSVQFSIKNRDDTDRGLTSKIKYPCVLLSIPIPGLCRLIFDRRSSEKI